MESKVLSYYVRCNCGSRGHQSESAHPIPDAFYGVSSEAVTVSLFHMKKILKVEMLNKEIGNAPEISKRRILPTHWKRRKPTLLNRKNTSMIRLVKM